MSKVVCLSPSNQDGNRYAYGNTNEAAQCQRIADYCKTALERNGIKVIMADNKHTMAQKCQMSDAGGADLHVPIHTNAGGKGAGGTRVYCATTAAGAECYKASKAICDRLSPVTPGKVAERVIAETSWYEIRVPKAPTAYIETDFHDVVEIAKFIVENAELLGETIAHGICDYFGIAFDDGTENDTGKGHEYSKEARAWAVREGIVEGMGKNEDGTTNFAWDHAVTREQLVTILYRMEQDRKS